MVTSTDKVVESCGFLVRAFRQTATASEIADVTFRYLYHQDSPEADN